MESVVWEEFRTFLPAPACLVEDTFLVIPLLCSQMQKTSLPRFPLQNTFWQFLPMVVSPRRLENGKRKKAIGFLTLFLCFWRGVIQNWLFLLQGSNFYRNVSSSLVPVFTDLGIEMLLLNMDVWFWSNARGKTLLWGGFGGEQQKRAWKWGSREKAGRRHIIKHISLVGSKGATGKFGRRCGVCFSIILRTLTYGIDHYSSVIEIPNSGTSSFPCVDELNVLIHGCRGSMIHFSAEHFCIYLCRGWGDMCLTQASSAIS